MYQVIGGLFINFLTIPGRVEGVVGLETVSKLLSGGKTKSVLADPLNLKKSVVFRLELGVYGLELIQHVSGTVLDGVELGLHDSGADEALTPFVL